MMPLFEKPYLQIKKGRAINLFRGVRALQFLSCSKKVPQN